MVVRIASPDVTRVRMLGELGPRDSNGSSFTLRLDIDRIEQLSAKCWTDLCLRIEVGQRRSTRCRVSRPDLAPQGGSLAFHRDRLVADRTA